MFNSLFDHIKNHKKAYSLGLVAALFAVGLYGYYGAPGMSDDSLAGRLSSKFTSRIIKRPPSKLPILKKPVLPCTESAWRCSAFQPDECPESEVRTRTCKLVDKKCSNPDSVKPAETEACEYVAPAAAEMQVNPVAAPSALYNGERTFLAFSVTPDQTTTITAMNFDVDLTDHNQDGLTVTAYKLFRGPNLIQTSASPSFTLSATETILAGTTQSYKLVGEVAGAKDGDVILTTLTMTGLVTDATVLGLPISFQLGEAVPEPADATVGKVASSSALTNGVINLVSFSVTADPASTGQVQITGMNFDLDIAEADSQGNLIVQDYQLYKGSSFLTSSDTPSISLSSPEVVPPGITQMYSLKAEIINAGMDDVISTTLPSGGLVTSSAVTGLPVNHTVMK